jgi:glyoxylase-like metal-dependent hydrolase (beta-lactamase superfamily II)
MNLYSINTGHFKLDGGAMFGVVPKSIWKNINPPDENNMCSWAMRCLLVEHDGKLVLIDNGMGTKQSEKFFGYYYLHGEDSLDQSLAGYGFHRDDITHVLLTHLHFDHCGGSIEWNSDKSAYRPAFKNAVYISNQKHWEWAVHPNVREKASFLRENFMPIKESGQLQFIQEGEDLFPGFSLLIVNGHTEAQMIPVIDCKGTKLVFCADLCPSAGHIKPSYVMAYDVRPLDSMAEREKVMKAAAANGHVLFFEHDPVNECATVKHTEKGFEVENLFRLNEW